MRLLLILALAGAALPARAESWRIRYFYDQDDSSLTINDLRFPSPERGVAVGFLAEHGRPKPVTLTSSDGGGKWSLVPGREIGLSLFFLDENHGWMVTEKGLWRTAEAGRSWERVRSPGRGVLRVHFVNPNRGWAVGASKAIWETRDGGKQWTAVQAASKPATRAEHTVYNWIDFANPKTGMIVGWSKPPRRREAAEPAWLDPEMAGRTREWPTTTILLQSVDGGETWKDSVSSMFGHVTRVRRTPDGRGLALVEFGEHFEWSSEVYAIEGATGGSSRVFRSKECSVTDVAVASNGVAYLAGIEKPGTLQQLPVPAKLKILRSEDWKSFREMDVDYRAFGRRAILAVAPGGGLWAATDGGMILKLE